MNRFDDLNFKLARDDRFLDDKQNMEIQVKIYPPINDPIRPMREPVDLRPLDRTLDMQDNFRRPLPEPIDPPRDIRPEPLRPINIAPPVELRPLNDMIMMQKKGVF